LFWGIPPACDPAAGGRLSVLGAVAFFSVVGAAALLSVLGAAAFRTSFDAAGAFPAAAAGAEVLSGGGACALLSTLAGAAFSGAAGAVVACFWEVAGDAGFCAGLVAVAPAAPELCETGVVAELAGEVEP
jgi:hypothetical protein